MPDDLADFCRGGGSAEHPVERAEQQAWRVRQQPGSLPGHASEKGPLGQRRERGNGFLATGDCEHPLGMRIPAELVRVEPLAEPLPLLPVAGDIPELAGAWLTIVSRDAMMVRRWARGSDRNRAGISSDTSPPAMWVA